MGWAEILAKMKDLANKTQFCDPQLIIELREGLDPQSSMGVYKEFFKYVYQSKRLKYISGTVIVISLALLEFFQLIF